MTMAFHRGLDICGFFCYKELYREGYWKVLFVISLFFFIFNFLVFFINISVSNPSFRKITSIAKKILTSIRTKWAIVLRDAVDFGTAMYIVLSASGHRWAARENVVCTSTGGCRGAGLL